MYTVVERTSVSTDGLLMLALDLAPHLLWGVVILVTFFAIGPKRFGEVLSNARKIGFAGFEVELSKEIEAAAKARQLELPPHVRERLAGRIARLQSLFDGARFLWIDEQPSNNKNEIEILSRLGAIIDLAISTEQAEQRLESGVYHIVLSDMTRGENQTAGEDIMPVAVNALLAPPVIYYTGTERPEPQGAFGLTTKLDKLFHLILDALERQRG